jgi:hypothetical protein
MAYRSFEGKTETRKSRRRASAKEFSSCRISYNAEAATNSPGNRDIIATTYYVDSSGQIASVTPSGACVTPGIPTTECSGTADYPTGSSFPAVSDINSSAFGVQFQVTHGGHLMASDETSFASTAQIEVCYN